MTTITDKLAEKVVGEPYRGKPDVRFDRRPRERAWRGMRHRQLAKAAGNSYSPRLQPGTEVLLYSMEKKSIEKHDKIAPGK